MTDLPNFEYPEKTEPISMVTLQGRCSPCGLDWSNHYDHLLSVTATQETAGTSGLQGQGGPSNERLLRRQLLRRHGEQPGPHLAAGHGPARPATWRWRSPTCCTAAAHPGDERGLVPPCHAVPVRDATRP